MLVVATTDDYCWDMNCEPTWNSTWTVQSCRLQGLPGVPAGMQSLVAAHNIEPVQVALHLVKQQTTDQGQLSSGPKSLDFKGCQGILTLWQQQLVIVAHTYEVCMTAQTAVEHSSTNK